jgi:hypothetical protein
LRQPSVPPWSFSSSAARGESGGAVVVEEEVLEGGEPGEGRQRAGERVAEDLQADERREVTDLDGPDAAVGVATDAVPGLRGGGVGGVRA